MSFGIYRGSLSALCEKLGVYREDDCAHQAGSDSKITAKSFFALLKIGDGSIEACKGDIYGLTQSIKTVLKTKISAGDYST